MFASVISLKRVVPGTPRETGASLGFAERKIHSDLAVRKLKRKLFLEEILESLAGVVGARRGLSGGRYLSGLGVRSGSGVFFNSHPEFVELAVVFGVFGGDTFSDGLGALELGTGIKETTLLTAVEFKLALGTLTVGVETRS
jgi:hypothetical protein